MTDDVTVGTDDDGVDWGGMDAPGMADPVATWTPGDVGAVKVMTTYPEHSDNPHNHRFTLSVTGSGAPMMVIRGNTAAEITAAINELESYGVWANVGAAHASMRAQGALGNGLGPATPVSPQAPPPGLPQTPPPPQPSFPGSGPTPPPFGPNVSVPGAPGYQGPPQQSYQSAPPPQGGGWGGSGGGGRDPKPRPQGWAMVDVPFNDKERFKQIRAGAGDYLRGKVQWGGKGMYWLEPSVAGWIAQQGFPVSQ